jgi:hypothetical protein
MCRLSEEAKNVSGEWPGSDRGVKFWDRGVQGAAGIQFEDVMNWKTHYLLRSTPLPALPGFDSTLG